MWYEVTFTVGVKIVVSLLLFCRMVVSVVGSLVVLVMSETRFADAVVVKNKAVSIMNKQYAVDPSWSYSHWSV